MTKQDISFVDLVLPNVGVYVVAPFASRPGEDAIPYQVFARDKAQFTRSSIIEDAKRNQTVYFSTATVLAEIGGNRHANLAAKKCLHIDIDVGHDDFAKTQAEAVDDLYKLCDVVGIPPPSVLVSSGYGVHAYWSMRVHFTSADIHEWQRLSDGLVAAAEQHTPKLTKDISKWKDRTALLRMPGTANKKKAVWVPVEEIGGSYLEYPRDAFDKLRSFAPERRVVVVAGKRDIALVDGEVLQTHCAVIRDLMTRPKIGYHAWRDLIHYSHHTTQGVQWAHTLSEGPYYNPTSLDSKYAYYVDKYDAGEYHPPRCSSFCADAGLRHGEVCAGCPLFLAGKTPLALRAATPMKAAATADITHLQTYAQPTVDMPFFFNDVSPEEGSSYHLLEDGGMGRTPTQFVEGDQGGKLFSHAWWCVSRADENNVTYYEVARVMAATTERGDDGVAKVVPKTTTRMRLKGDSFSDPKMIVKNLGSIGVHIEDAKDPKQRYHAYRYACLARNSCLTIRDAATSFGWQADRERFVLGLGAFHSDGGVEPYVMGGQLQNLDNRTRVATGAVNPAASLLGVVTALKEFNAHSSKLGKALLLAALATPLFKLVELPGYVILLAGQGGKGKTSLQSLISCLYSKPDATMITGQDTLSSWPATIGLYNSLPITFDEFTVAGQSSGQQATEANKDHFIYMVTNGRTKKVNSAEQVQLGGDASWSTLVVASSNWDYVSGLKARDYTDRCDAILARMSQVSIGGGIMGLAEWVKVERLFVDNHGLIGAKFIAHMMAHLGEIKQYLADEFTAAMQGRPQEARFKAKLLAAIMVAQRVLKVDSVVDFGLTAAEVADLLELDRLDPTRNATSVWNRESVAQPGSQMQMDLLDYVLQAKQDTLLYFREDATGNQIPIASNTLPRRVYGTAVRGVSGDTTYTLSRALILGDKDLSTIQSLPSVLGGMESVRTCLTQGGPIVDCIRIHRLTSVNVATGNGAVQ